MPGEPDPWSHEMEEDAVTERTREPSSPAAATDHLVRNAARYAAGFRPTAPTARPALQVTVLTCMDARIDPVRLLGLEPGDAHVLRNAGAVVTPDVRRSLTISQRLLGTRAVVVIRHTGCGMFGLTEAFADGLAAEVGTRPDWQVHGFADLETGLREGLGTLRTDPFLLHTDQIRGFVYDVATGKLHEVCDNPTERAA
jgi:carbonic anhydrase